MGEQGEKLTQDATSVSDQVVRDLAPVGDVSSPKMFGGYGIFETGAMFALVNSQGEVFLKVADANRDRFADAGAKQHGKMPCFQVPREVLEDANVFCNWAETSVAIAHAAKKK